jgi:hypothetical protein
METTVTPETVGDEMIPAEVRELLEEGRLALAEKRSAEARARLQASAEREGRIARALEPVWAAIGNLLPLTPTLRPYLHLDNTDFAHCEPRVVEAKTIFHFKLMIPGFDEICLTIQRASPSRWQIYDGLHVSGQPIVNSLPEALALARESWLVRQRELSEVPF